MSACQTPSSADDSLTPTSHTPSSLSGSSERVLIQVNPADIKAARDDIDAEKGSEYEIDSSIPVDWDGPDDPQNPMNWTDFRKWLTIGLIAFSSFNVSMVSTIFAPAVPQVLDEFGTHDSAMSSLMVSIYVMGAAVGPIFLTPFTELTGRLPITHAANVLFVVAAAVGGGSVNMAMLIIARFVMGIASSVPCTVGGGFIADLMPVERRGRAMTIWTVGLLLGSITGPIFGGYMAMSIGWRWTIWLEAVLGAFIAITSIIFLRETYHPTLLHRKAVQLQKTTGKPHITIYKQEQGRLSPGYIIRTSISRPLKLLFLSPIVSSISLFCSLAYSYMYILFTTFTSVFMNIYGFNAGEAGLAYLGLGLGFAVGQLTVGYFSDRHMQRQKARYGVMRPEDRLPPMVVGVFLIPVGLVWYGWSAEARTHWIVPIVGTFFVGVGIYYVTLVTQVYLVDAFTIYAASAVSAESSLRSVFGAVLPLAGPPLYARLGMGWGNTLLAFVAAAFAPTSFLLIRYGEKIRTNPRFQPKLA